MGKKAQNRKAKNSKASNASKAATSAFGNVWMDYASGVLTEIIVGLHGRESYEWKFNGGGYIRFPPIFPHH